MYKIIDKIAGVIYQTEKKEDVEIKLDELKNQYGTKMIVHKNNTEYILKERRN